MTFQTLRNLFAAACLGLSMLASGAAADEPATPVVDSPAGQRAFDDLAAYYEDNDAVPKYTIPLAHLGSGDEQEREAANAYIFALFKQSLADESNGRAPWRSLPYWGGGQAATRRCSANGWPKRLGPASTRPRPWTRRSGC